MAPTYDVLGFFSIMKPSTHLFFQGYGSEHLLDGVKFDGETHFVFKWAPGQDKETEDAAVAFGFLMTEGDSTTGAAKNVIEGVLAPNLDKISKVGSVKIPGIDLTSLGETRTGEEYFAYKGSLTTPPFAECVIHVVFKNPLTVTKVVKYTVFLPRIFKTSSFFEKYCFFVFYCVFLLGKLLSKIMCCQMFHCIQI